MEGSLRGAKGPARSLSGTERAARSLLRRRRKRSEPVKKSSAGDRQAVVNMRSLSHEQRAFAVS